MHPRCVPVLIAFAFCLTDVHGQSGRLLVEREVIAAVGANGRAPFWIESNRLGVIPSAGTSLLSRAAIHAPFRHERSLELSFGGELIARPAGVSSVYFSQIYARARYGRYELRAGRFAETSGIYDVPLSTGSFITSGNATPLPKIALLTEGFVPLPLGGGRVEASGYLAHGWFEKDRFVQSPLLHEKHAYLRFGGSAPVRLHAGIVHAAMWGGRSHPEEGDLPASFRDFTRVFFVRAGDENSPASDQAYVLGKHLGFWDFGLAYRFRKYHFRAYRHFAIEEGFAARFRTPEDGLFGAGIRVDAGRAIVTGILYEHLYTKRQTPRAHPRTAGEVSNIYNHYLYRNGWTHHGRTLGSPLLFLARESFNPAEHLAVSINNRVVAHHAGIEGFAGPAPYRLLFTYSRNYGQYLDQFEMERTGAPHPFVDGPWQISMLVEAASPFFLDGFQIRGAVAADLGSVRPQNAGIMVGLRWSAGERKE